MKATLWAVMVTSLLISVACEPVNVNTSIASQQSYAVIDNPLELRDQFNSFNDALKLVFIVGPS